MKRDYTFDRRKYRRVETESIMSVAHVDAPTALATTVDVSRGGIRFQCVGLEVEVGQTIRVELTLEDQTLNVIGTLVRVTELDAFAQDVALAFSDVDPDTQQLLEDVLAAGDD